MSVVAHLVGLEQLGYEKSLGMTLGVSAATLFTSHSVENATFYSFQVMNNDHSWRGMIIKDNEGDWGLCVAAWRGMKKGRPGIPGKYAKTQC